MKLEDRYNNKYRETNQIWLWQHLDRDNWYITPPKYTPEISNVYSKEFIQMKYKNIRKAKYQQYSDFILYIAEAK